jgi:hypothetical protein
MMRRRRRKGVEEKRSKEVIEPEILYSFTPLLLYSFTPILLFSFHPGISLGVSASNRIEQNRLRGCYAAAHAGRGGGGIVVRLRRGDGSAIAKRAGRQQFRID